VAGLAVYIPLPNSPSNFIFPSSFLAPLLKMQSSQFAFIQEKESFALAFFLI
jgi:hypothetical protein